MKEYLGTHSINVLKLTTTTAKKTFDNALALPPYFRAELTERRFACLADGVSPEITGAQLVEVRRRIAQVESGEAALIPGDKALARVRGLLAGHIPSR